MMRMASAGTTRTTPVRGGGNRDACVLVLAGGIVMGVALGVRHAQGLFLLPVSLEHGWSRETFGFAIALQNLVWGLAQPLAGMIADRFGSAKVIAGGLVFNALGLVLMAHATTPAALLWSAGVCIGIGLSGSTFSAIYGALSRLVVVERRGWALGLAGAVGGLGQFAMVPAAQGLIEGLGWAGALVALAVLTATLLPLALPLADRTATGAREAAGPATGADGLRSAMAEAFRHRGFWLLNLGFVACGFQLAFIATHLPAYLLDRGLTAADGVVALAVIALANVAGTYACGVLGGIYRRKKLLAGIYLGRALAIALFASLPASSAGLYLFAAVMGLGWLGTAPLTNGLVSQVFGVRYVATLFGFVFLGHQVGSFAGVWLGSAVFEATGSYDPVWFMAVAIGLIAAALHWPIDDRAIRRPAAAGA